MKMNGNSTLTALATVLALEALACDAMTLVGNVDAGMTEQDGGMTPPPNGYRQDGGGTCTPPPYAGDVPYTLPTGVAGSWTGYFQGCPSVTALTGSDVIKMTLAESPGRSGQIDLVFGTNPPPPPATSATDYYPPGFSPGQSFEPRTFQGVSYRAHAVTWQGQRLKFSLAVLQVWDDWCELQSSYAVTQAVPGYNCIPGNGGAVTNVGQPGETCYAGNNGQNTLVSCAQFYLCAYQVCTCDMCGCAGSTSYTDSFDVTFEGDLVTGAGSGCAVRLTRDP